MFYIRNRKNGKLGVVDTKDGVCEYYTPSEVAQISMQLDIKKSVDYNDSEIQYFSDKMVRKLYRDLLRGSVGQNYFDGMAFPVLDSIIAHKDGYYLSIDKMYNYGDTHGFFLLLIHIIGEGVVKGTVFVNVNEFGRIHYRVYNELLTTRYYTSMSGYGYNNLVRQNSGVFPNLASDNLYLLVYNLNTEMAYFLSSVTFDIVYSVKMVNKSAFFK